MGRPLGVRQPVANTVTALMTVGIPCGDEATFNFKDYYAAAEQVARDSAFLSVGLSHARHPSGNRT